MRGFSLLELSIVLVIIGLIAGGIVGGASMIRAAELRAVVTQHGQFKTAVNVFRDKYFGIPGDLKNATAFWGKNNTACSADSGVASATGTCNGDGDAVIDLATAANARGENYGFWHHLNLAGLVEGNYSGLSGSSGQDHATEDNSANGKISGTLWWLWNGGTQASGSSWFTGDYTRAVIYGSQATGSWPSGATMTPAEAWNLDKKIDDGKPAQGSMWVMYSGGCTLATANTQNDTDYDLQDDSQLCVLMFKDVY